MVTPDTVIEKLEKTFVRAKHKYIFTPIADFADTKEGTWISKCLKINF